MKRFFLSFTFVGVLVLIAQGTVAMDFVAAPVDDVEAIGEAGNELSLGLDRAREIALSRNLDLQLGRYDLAISDTSVERASGLFDPNFNFGVNGDYTESPASSQLEGAVVNESRGTSFNLGLGALMPTGGNLSLDFSTRRSETNSQFFFLNPNWNSRLSASLTQPLLKNFGTMVSRSGIVIARKNRKQATETLKIQVVGVIQLVDQAYWNYVATQVAARVKGQSLELAEQLLEETRERIRVGTSAPIDQIQSEASVAARRQDLILAENAQANAEDALKKVLGFETGEEWALNIATTESYDFEPVKADLEESIQEAMSRRPEFLRQKLGIELSDLQLRLARNALLPKLDLKASYGFGGLGGTLKMMDPDTGEELRIKGGFDDSFDQIVNMDYPQWTLGLNFTMPLGNTTAKADLARRRYEKDRSEAQLAALRQSITHEVRLAVRGLKDGAASVDAAVASRKAAEKKVEAEQTKFENGLSTNFQVLQIQDDLAAARLTEIQSKLSYRKAIIAYRVATGKLLSSFGIEFVDDGPPEDAHTLWKDVKWMQFVDLAGKDESEPVEEKAEGNVS